MHLLSAWATRPRLVLGARRRSPAGKSNEIVAIPLLLERLAREGALVTIDAIGTQSAIAAAIRGRGGDYLLALKANRPALLAEVEALVADPPPGMVLRHETWEKDHGRIESRRGAERRARLSLSGPHRDRVRIMIDGEEAAGVASSGQARSALLALTLAAAEVYREERGQRATLLLDDLDSELDFARTRELCERVALDGQALITTAHPAWAAELDGLARRFAVRAGEVRPA